MPAEHAPGCVLDPVHWLRHATAAAGQFVAADSDPADVPQYDRVSAEALTDSLAHFAELSDWSTVTLLDLARNATLMNDGRFDQFCTCGATR
jgi:hypothetical protein